MPAIFAFLGRMLCVGGDFFIMLFYYFVAVAAVERGAGGEGHRDACAAFVSCRRGACPGHY